jgi:hypothetical protein
MRLNPVRPAKIAVEGNTDADQSQPMSLTDFLANRGRHDVSSSIEIDMSASSVIATAPMGKALPPGSCAMVLHWIGRDTVAAPTPAKKAMPKRGRSVSGRGNSKSPGNGARRTVRRCCEKPACRYQIVSKTPIPETELVKDRNITTDSSVSARPSGDLPQLALLERHLAMWTGRI